MRRQSPFTPFLNNQGALILDGGLATELESRGHDLDTPLWSANLLATHPGAIASVHLAYLEAGADCITSATYQASIAGFVAGGWSEDESRALIGKAVALAISARKSFMRSQPGRLKPLVAASIGPYGAYLANGAEYTGDYQISKQTLRDFHQPRWEILSASEADLLACETIPSFDEAQVLLELLEQTPEREAWISFSCRDGRHISDGTPIRDCVALLEGCSQVLAVGVNCTAPRHVFSLVNEIQAADPTTDIIVYPNSGEVYDPATRTWMELREPVSYSLAAQQWLDGGARLVGGCCRIGPEHIRVMRETLLTS